MIGDCQGDALRRFQFTIFNQAGKILGGMQDFQVAPQMKLLIEYLKGLVAIGTARYQSLGSGLFNLVHILFSLIQEIRLVTHLVSPTPAAKFVGSADAEVDSGFLQ